MVDEVGLLHHGPDHTGHPDRRRLPTRDDRSPRPRHLDPRPRRCRVAAGGTDHRCAPSWPPGSDVRRRPRCGVSSDHGGGAEQAHDRRRGVLVAPRPLGVAVVGVHHLLDRLDGDGDLDCQADGAGRRDGVTPFDGLARSNLDRSDRRAVDRQSRVPRTSGWSGGRLLDHARDAARVARARRARRPRSRRVRRVEPPSLRALQLHDDDAHAGTRDRVPCDRRGPRPPTRSLAARRRHRDHAGVPTRGCRGARLRRTGVHHRTGQRTDVPTTRPPHATSPTASPATWSTAPSSSTTTCSPRRTPSISSPRHAPAISMRRGCW